jgi:hypothetical protein
MQNPLSVVSPKEKEDILTQFQDLVSGYCDKCGKPYNKKNINIIQKQDNVYVLHLLCENCKSNMLTYVIKSIGMSNKVQIYTDLSVDEMKDIANSSPVKSDDLLDICEIFEKDMRAEDFINLLTR